MHKDIKAFKTYLCKILEVRCVSGKKNELKLSECFQKKVKLFGYVDLRVLS